MQQSVKPHQKIASILPWQQDIWQSLWQRKQRNQLPHALLFAGMDGVGKTHLAQQLANALLCHVPHENGQVCGLCKGCQLTAAQFHPDLKWITPIEDAQLIKIDQIRELIQFVNETPLLGGYRVIIIHPAAALNIAAANALLKTLEEPTANTLLILICDQRLRLPATIVSRCQRVSFPKPDAATALTWLQAHQSPELQLLLTLTEGAPLKAKELFATDFLKHRHALYDGLVQLAQRREDPLRFAAKWQTREALPVLQLLLTWLRDLLRTQLTHAQTTLLNHDYSDAINALRGRFSSERLLNYIDDIQQIYARALQAFNANKQLLWEDIFIRWVQLCS